MSTYADLKNEVGRFLGYSETEANWSADQLSDVEKMVDAGLSRFYWPPPHNGLRHEWSFLKPVQSIIVWPTVDPGTATTVSGGAFSGGVTTVTASAAAFFPSMKGHTIVIDGIGSFVIDSYTSATAVVVTGDASTASADEFTITATGDYRLPLSISRLDGDLTFVDENNYYPSVVAVTNEMYIRTLRQANTNARRPRYAAVRPVVEAPSEQQQWELMLYPVPDQEYTLDYRFTVTPEVLTDDAGYPWGGRQHFQTILSACLSVAEERMDDQRGVRHAAFIEALAASIMVDRRTAASNLGYNGDISQISPRMLGRLSSQRRALTGTTFTAHGNQIL